MAMPAADVKADVKAAFVAASESTWVRTREKRASQYTATTVAAPNSDARQSRIRRAAATPAIQIRASNKKKMTRKRSSICRTVR
jgi:hypothetical protein